MNTIAKAILISTALTLPALSGNAYSHQQRWLHDDGTRNDEHAHEHDDGTNGGTSGPGRLNHLMPLVRSN
jgi:hypothetical protein